MTHGLRKRRNYPYYKIQIYNIQILTWKDEKKIFDTLKDAQSYIKSNCKNEDVRIVEVHRESRSIIEDTIED